MRLLLLPEEMLHPRARSHEPGAQRDGVLGPDCDGLQQSAVAVGEMSGRGQRLGAGEEELDALLGGRVLWEQPKSTCEPAGGACRREPGRCLGPASRRSATAATSPSRAERSTWC